MKKSLLMMMTLGSSLLMTQAQQLAFPGAEGFGKYAVGGRNGSVYHVTNLNDSGSGSLRDAVSQSNRIIVFDVAGVIHLQSGLVFKNNLYIAGQTAPGEGITVYGDRVSFSGASNTICRYIRFRMGVNGSSNKDACGVANGTNMIFDHLSVSWGQDETFSISPDGKGDLGDITIQNSIMSQGLLSHSAGGLMQADNITLYRNLYVDNSTRNNKIKGKNQYVNNIVYNWKNGCYIMGGDSEGTSYAIAEGNLFINGPSGGGNAFGGGNADYHIYAADNWQDANKDGVLNPYEIPQSEYTGGPTFHTERFDYPEVPLWKSSELIEKSLPRVGASLPYRDYADWYVINEVLSFGKKGELISRETSLPFGAPTSWNLWAGNKKTDTDGDGMPDAWESANGTDPAKNDAMVIADNGYANIENYINSITVDDREAYLRKQICLELDTYTQNSLSFSWLNYTEGETGVSVEVKEGDTFKEIARLAADADSYTMEGLEPETAYTVRLRAFDDNGNYSDYSDEVTMKTKPIPVEMVDIATYSPDYTWSVVSGTWDYTSGNWGDALYTDASKVLFNSIDDVEVTLNETVSPASVVVESDALTTISGSGAIGGTASVNKDGEGTLVLNTANTYTGQTVLHGGTIEFNSLANGGVASAIGASSEFAQNWIWDGGVWDYTGGNASTNRQALTYEQTEFNISNKATVTMKGHIEGSGGLTLNGNGQVTVASDNFFQYTGPTILKGSTLYLSTTEISKAGIGKSSKLVMAGGELKTKGETEDYETYSFPIEVQDGTYSYFSPNRNCYINNTVTGTGTLQFNVPYLREYVGSGFNSFKGRLVANGVNSSGENLLLIQDGADPFANCIVELKSGAKMAAWKTNASCNVGGLSGDAGTYLCGSSKKTKGFKCTWTVGGANTDETFRGVINDLPAGLNSAYSGTVTIIKKGSGDWRLTGKNVYSGTTMVTGTGRLIVNGTHSGTGAVSVYKGSTLAGYGTLNGKVTVKSGATVASGDTIVNTAHMLKLKGGLTVDNGGTVTIPVKVSEDGVVTVCKLNVTGAMAINGATLNLEFESGQENLKAGTSFTLFSMSGVTGGSITGEGFTTIEPAVPGEGLEWDTSKLLTEGCLSVKEASSIDNALADETKVWPLTVQSGLNISLPAPAQVTVYSLTGEMVKSVALPQGTHTVGVAELSKGIYLAKVGDKVFRVVKK